jgi:hypothetical protein
VITIQLTHKCRIRDGYSTVDFRQTWSKAMERIRSGSVCIPADQDDAAKINGLVLGTSSFEVPGKANWGWVLLSQGRRSCMNFRRLAIRQIRWHHGHDMRD